MSGTNSGTLADAGISADFDLMASRDAALLVDPHVAAMVKTLRAWNHTGKT